METKNNICSRLLTTFQFPFKPHRYQEEGVEEISKRACSLLRYKVGLGKTATGTWAALASSIFEDVEQLLIICTPILIDQWAGFLSAIGGLPSVEIYRSSPVARKKIDIESAAVIIVSYNIFRRPKEFKRFQNIAKKRKLCVIADEFTAKSLKGKTYRCMKQILYRKLRVSAVDRCYHKFIALNATPISDPVHVYNWAALMNPGEFISLRTFLNRYAEETDPWGKVTKWTKLGELAEALDRFTVDTTEVIGLPELVETVVPYDLSPAHKKLYAAVKKAKVDEIAPDKVQFSMDALFCALQEVVILPSVYGLDIQSPAIDFIKAQLDQISPDDGVLIYTRHVAISKAIAEAIPEAVAIYGGISAKARATGFAKLQSGEARILVGNIDSLGAGLNLQMLSYTIYLELPFRDDKLTQTLGRTHRQGQKKTCFAIYPMAKGTVQASIYNKLIKNGDLISQVVKDKKSLDAFLS